VKVEIISATRKSAAEFAARSALGRSLHRLLFDRSLVARVTVENKTGLPELYNGVLATIPDDSIAVFMHDDVWIDDHFFTQRIAEGLRWFDLIGVVGNRRRIPRQPSWAYVDDKQTWDNRENFSGTIAHGNHPFGSIAWFGPAPQECELLDGVCLAARKSVLVEKGVAFDERFKFHFYDVDFCRTARQKGLKLGTWPVCLTHESPGEFGDAWRAGYQDYLAKWGD
jgi:hypothetical protein